MQSYESYVIRPYGDSTATVITYPTQALSLLPQAILPCTPIDTPDFQYLNHSHAPLPHPYTWKMLDVAECLLYCGYLGLDRDLDLLKIVQMDDRFVLKKSFGLTWFSDENLR